MAKAGNSAMGMWLFLESLPCRDAMKSYTGCALVKEFRLDGL